ncbi:hypothetical protein JAAARDRAFT_42568 [Jaapia argillacea MUCL 33604]|uniref:Uncharacterized protein n=1 Tax=Jaapia argillacea MUCL 33604 TaxID=933084 RepID=A0A067P495_9AGAM|nr:hypothetical protein JAAARDRAFT_42568 [Jaapia argillacea MUCL 33604]
MVFLGVGVGVESGGDTGRRDGWFVGKARVWRGVMNHTAAYPIYAYTVHQSNNLTLIPAERPHPQPQPQPQPIQAQAPKRGACSHINLLLSSHWHPQLCTSPALSYPFSALPSAMPTITLEPVEGDRRSTEILEG